ncbi:hypothetical protein K439DRAFT_1201628 [Ramaria rubella]|nr:hypothetical protein K439DRAFT_1201628 [Ramaria rubella]
MRALERIEKLKQEGRWSFRQPKKQKGPIIAKSNWDWMIDEMRWMRTDFREERRWKIAVAFNLAHDVRAWHFATPDERKSLCIRNSPSRRSFVELETSPMEVEMRLGLDITVKELEPSGGSKRFTVDLPPLENEHSAELDPEREVEIIRTQQRGQRKDTQVEKSRESSRRDEDVDADGEADADGEMDVDDNEGDADGAEADGDKMQTNENNTSTRPQTPSEKQLPLVNDTPQTLGSNNGLKDGSSDPTLAADPDKLPGTIAQTATPVDKLKSQLRVSLLFAPDAATSFNIDTLCSNSHLLTLDPFVPLQLPEIFPDLTTFQPLFSSPGQIESIIVPKGDKKSEKKDKKVVEELTRIDDTAGLKVVSVSTFMHYKPTLVSALQPAKRWRDNTWVELDDTVIVGDDTPVSLEPSPNGLFGHQKPRPLGMSSFNTAVRMPKDAQKRFNETPWSPSEDQILKHFADRYPSNWALIADMFNSSRVTISTDKRTAWDCLARWDARWNEGRILMPANGPTTPGSAVEGSAADSANFSTSVSTSVPPTPVVAQPMFNAIMTRKRSASQINLSITGQQAESRKRRRHNHMHEAMRKSAKKREINMKQIANQNKRGPTSQVHETHAAFNKPNNRTPAELSRIKAERDRREHEEYLQRKKQEDDNMRKHRTQMELLKQQMGGSLRGAMQAPASASQADAARRAQAATGQQPVAVPIIRGPGHPQVNISQQTARIPTALGAANLGVPNLAQGIPLSTGMNINVQNFQRLSPQQQQALYAQMQARQAHLQAQQVAQAQAQAQAQQQQPQPQQQQPSQSQSQPQPPNPVPGSVPNSNAGQHTPTPPRPQTSPGQAHATPHHQIHPQSSPPRHSTPTNGVGLVNIGANTLVRPASSQHLQPPRSGPSPHVPSQPPRPSSSQHPQPHAQAVRQGSQQQQAMHHAFMQNQHAAGMSQEQMKRLYQNQLYWQQGNAQSQAGHITYQGMPQQQQQQHSPPRPMSVQPNPGATPGSQSGGT